MKVILKEGFTYVPEWNENKEAKPKDQFSVDFNFLAGSDLASIYNKDGTINKAAEWLVICKSVNNLVINDNPITPEDISNMKGLSALYVELQMAFRLEAEVDKKKL